MGTWDIEPWDNDIAADWFGDIFKKTKLAEYTRQTLQNCDPHYEFEEVRAAAFLVSVLGHVYVWPIEHRDQDIALAVSKLEQVLTSPKLNEDGEDGKFNKMLREKIQEEIQELRSWTKKSKVEPLSNKG